MSVPISPIQIKQTVLAVLETKPEQRQMKKQKRSLKSLKEEVSNKRLSLDALLREWLDDKRRGDPNLTAADRYYQGASSFREFLQNKLGN